MTAVSPRLAADAFDREVRALLAAARWSCADLECVLATTARVDLWDADSWLREWTAAGGAAWANSRGERDRRGLLHAATYYGAALALIEGSDGLVDEAALWMRQRECWDRGIDVLGGEAVSIPYERTTLPGYFFCGGGGRRPVVVVDPGGRIVTSEAWGRVGGAARARGFHVLIVDGPGRQGALQLGGLVLRPDWEAVLGPVADWLHARADVDAGRMAIAGLEFAGLGVARAVSAEHRFAAAAVIPGILDASRPWVEQLPLGARDALLEDDADAFERELHLASLFVPETEARLRRAARWFDHGNTPLFELYQRVRSYRLGEELCLVQTPTMVCEPAEGGLWTGQGLELARRLGGSGALVRGRRAADALESWLDIAF